MKRLGVAAVGLAMAAAAVAAPPAASAPASAGGAARARHLQKPAPSPSPSLCLAGEEIHFSCPVSRQRVVSVCGSKGAAGEDLLQYRVGVPGAAPELAFPQRPAPPQGRFELVSSGGAKSLLLNLRFRIGGTSYVVYRYSGRFDDGEAGVAARTTAGAWRYTPCEREVEQPGFTSMYRLDIDVDEPDFDRLVFPPAP